MTTTQSKSAIWSTIKSPIGPITVRVSGGSIVRLDMDKGRHVPDLPPERADGITDLTDRRVLNDAMDQLTEWFAGTRTMFDLPLDLGGTKFQQSVWKQLCLIPYGETISYGELARRLGKPTAYRAVGLANGRNPVSIIVPCHRVIATDGTLGGYGGGLDRKTWLLEHERAVAGIDDGQLPLA